MEYLPNNKVADPMVCDGFAGFDLSFVAKGPPCFGDTKKIGSTLSAFDLLTMFPLTGMLSLDDDGDGDEDDEDNDAVDHDPLFFSAWFPSSPFVSFDLDVVTRCFTFFHLLASFRVI